MLDNKSARYSVIGNTELRIHSRQLVKGDITMHPKPRELRRFDFWQFGAGSNSSDRRAILGYIVYYMLSDNEKVVAVCHLVIDGSSQWVLGQKGMSMCNIIHIDRHPIDMPQIS